MISKKLFRNEDAVSISIGYILISGVTVLIFVAILLSFYTLSLSTEKSAMQQSFKIMGSGIAARITLADTLINTMKYNGVTVNNMEYEFSIPESVAGKSYSVNITNSTHEVLIESDNGARIAIPFNIASNFDDRDIYSGAETYRIIYKNNILYIIQYV